MLEATEGLVGARASPLTPLMPEDAVLEVAFERVRRACIGGCAAVCWGCWDIVGVKADCWFVYLCERVWVRMVEPEGVRECEGCLV